MRNNGLFASLRRSSMGISFKLIAWEDCSEERAWLFLFSVMYIQTHLNIAILHDFILIIVASSTQSQQKTRKTYK
jgi:hypothetical protein